MLFQNEFELAERLRCSLVPTSVSADHLAGEAEGPYVDGQDWAEYLHGRLGWLVVHRAGRAGLWLPEQGWFWREAASAEEALARELIGVVGEPLREEVVE